MQMPDPIKLGFNQPFYRAVEELKKRGVVLPDKYHRELQGLHRQLNFSIAGKASLDQLQAVLDSLEDAMKQGKTFHEWQKDVRVQDLGLPKHRLDNIFRTNIQAAYNRGHWEKFVENQKIRPYLMYDAINDSRVRPSHLAMDGIIRPVGDAFWATHYPPNGFRCRCRCISLSEKQAQERSKNGTGLNKSITPEMNPDKGWDYNVGQDLTTGIDKAIAENKAHPMLKQALSSLEKPSSFTPVSNALILPKDGIAKEVAQNVLAEIDKIHGDGKLPKIPVSLTNSEVYGALYRRVTESESRDILIGASTAEPEFDFAHEIGHFLDHQAIGKAGVFASESSDLMTGWFDAVVNSEAIKEIFALPEGTKLRGYFLNVTEIWARCYAQYITIKSQNPTLLKQLDDVRLGDFLDPIHNLSQWKDYDFESIMSEIDKLFLILGWKNND